MKREKRKSCNKCRYSTRKISHMINHSIKHVKIQDQTGGAFYDILKNIFIYKSGVSPPHGEWNI